ncbi:class II aldolase/adducin family protein [Thioalkalivibrio sp. HK1]|uniref:class II aldolase/adducin family protein n=1 Tax=Thioalkalivibrio sp. HK1 TaxID=1469245 RepID=UPI000470A41A|nr:class II aldolase/adducin family protein [Thioalkalivibrio sp. HK1]
MDAIRAVSDSRFSRQEWQVRCDLAACYRAFVKFGWTDLIYTHISARHPSIDDRYYINPYGLLFDEITASNLIEVDFEGNVVQGDYPLNDAGHAIHSTILQHRPDLNWILHTHTRAGMAVSCMREGLLPITQQAMLFDGHLAYHEYDLQTSGPEECERLVADLGTHNMMILHNHGLLSCAAGVARAFTMLYNLENACKVQVDVLSSRAEIIHPRPEAVERLAQYGSPSGSEPCQLEWEAVLRMLDREDPSYRH